MMALPRKRFAFLALPWLVSLPAPAAAQSAQHGLPLATDGNGREDLGPGVVISHQKISNDAGGFLDTLDPDDEFGGAVAALGVLDGDGVGEVAVGAAFDFD